MDYIQKENESCQSNINTINTTSIKNTFYLSSAISDGETDQSECAFNSFLTQKQFALECPIIEDINLNDTIIPGVFEFKTVKDAPYRTFLNPTNLKLSLLSLS